MSSRRSFIALLGGAVAAWPMAARAQQQMPVVGWLSSRTAATDASVLPSFREGLKAQGFEEGRNIEVEYRWAETDTDQLPALAADLLRRQIAVIVAVGSGLLATRSARMISASVPIVFLTGADPIKVGLVPNLNHPGGNTTGATAYFRSLAPKRLELLHELFPSSRTMVVLASSSIIRETADYRPELEQAAHQLGKELRFVEVTDDHGLSAALSKLSDRRPDAMMVESGGLFFSRAKEIVATAARLAIPAMYFRREFAIAGGLMSYGSNSEGNYRVLGDYAGRIIKGEQAGNLPIQQPTTFNLVLNLKTAKASGLTVPPTLLARADEVIE